MKFLKLSIFLLGVSGQLNSNTNQGKRRQVHVSQSIVTSGSSKQVPNNVALDHLKKYLSFDTSHPIPGSSKTEADYSLVKNFIIDYAKQLDLNYTIFECKPGKPLIVLKYEGKNPKLPSLMFNSHMDVVAASPEFWKYPPFSPTLAKDENGDDIIYARGAQDTKTIGIVYMEALRILKASKFQPERNLYIVFSPDEEIGGKDGIGCWVKSKEFESLDVAFAFDEGGTSGNDHIFSATYSERARWAFTAIANGNTGHASMFIENLATNKIEKFHDYIKQFRLEQKSKANPDNTWDGSVTSVNLDFVSGGIALNVIPPQINYTYDMRVSPLQDQKSLSDLLYSWAKSSDVKLIFWDKEQSFTTPNLTDNKFFKRLNEISKTHFDAEVVPFVLPAVSDSRHLRALNIPAIGFCPYRTLPVMAHQHNEFMKLNIFYEAIQFYKLAIPLLSKE